MIIEVTGLLSSDTSSADVEGDWGGEGGTPWCVAGSLVDVFLFAGVVSEIISGGVDDCVVDFVAGSFVFDVDSE